MVDVVGGDDGVERIGKACRGEGIVDQESRRVGGQAQPDTLEIAQSLDQVDCPWSRVDLHSHPIVHERRALLDQLRSALERPAQPLGEIARGDLEIGADDPHLILVRELRAVAAKELGLGIVPEGLRVEQEAIHVEDDGPIASGERHPIPARRRTSHRRHRGSGGAA
jgi:hypothetical protein